MKRKSIVFSIIVCIFFGLLSIVLLNKDNEHYIDNNKLYKVAIEYIINNDDNPEKDNERYKLFTDYKGFATTEDDEYRYAYMWISIESYYINENKIISSSGSSMPYKFIFAKKDDKVIKTEIPKDGSEYASSIKSMFPRKLINKVLKYKYDDAKLKLKVEDYYSNLEDTTIYYFIGDGYTFDGKIMEVGKNYILVEVLEKTDTFNKTDKVKVNINESLNDFYTKGSKVRITFNGSINESNPMQINANAIELIN